MNTALAKEELAQILDQAVQDVTERTAGVRLQQGEQSPAGDLCTVQITFDKGFHTSLTLCADTGLLYRMACNSFHEHRGIRKPGRSGRIQQRIFQCALRQNSRGNVPGHTGSGSFWPAGLLSWTL